MRVQTTAALLAIRKQEEVTASFKPVSEVHLDGNRSLSVARWVPARNNNNNAWKLNSNGYFNNNFNNNNRACCVANLTKCCRCCWLMVTLDDLTKSYYKARANKRRSRDSVVFEIDYESELVRLMEDINSRSFVADGNYAFVVFSPKPREIFATRMRNRIVHHYLDWKMRPIYEMVLSDRSFNNREGMGLHKAIDTFRNDIKEMTEGYTKDAWLVHLDLKGYFPNADVEIALRQQLDLIERYYEGADKDDMKYMMESCMRADPARHCNIYVPLDRWDAIPDSKSLFHKLTGTGGAIGFSAGRTRWASILTRS